MATITRIRHPKWMDPLTDGFERSAEAWRTKRLAELTAELADPEWGRDNPVCSRRESAERELSRLQDTTPRQLCIDKLRRVHTERVHARWRERKNRQEWLSKVIASRLHARCRFGNYRVTNSRQQAVVDKLLDWVKDLPARVNRGEGLMLIGCTGTGKDHLLASVIRRAVLRHDIRVRWTSGADLASMWRRESEDEIVSYEYTRDPVVLAISDPAPAGPLTPFLSERMTALLDRHYRAGWPIWTTLNAPSREAMDAMLGAPIIDRLRANALIVVCDWPSYRKPLEVFAPE